jgi:hypothetical protein
MTSQAENPRPSRPRRHPPAAAIIALLALVMTSVGTGIAAHKLSGSAIKKRSEPGNRLRKNTLTGKEVKEASLKQVPKAADALTLQGRQPPDFVSADKLKRFSVSLNFGESKTLLSAGPFTFTAKCVQNATNPALDPNQDFSLILISTTQPGSVFDGNTFQKGTDPTDFLNPDTPEDGRVFIVPETVPTGLHNYDSGNDSDGAAFAPDGTAIAFEVSGLGGSINEFGANCTIDGFALVASG